MRARRSRYAAGPQTMSEPRKKIFSRCDEAGRDMGRPSRRRRARRGAHGRYISRVYAFRAGADDVSS